ncbi:MAG: pyruvate formate lyase activating enzyme [Candidatus Atribacteria bacterium]|uniref:Radical SAM protein n=1 Tax=Thermatribacter velox TaxID=3039681 RepID=A0ABZ2YFE1_9BACT|nr:pyruvate formate lyase activating enzyme [Candidatus Atribacteria bacterium]
MGTCNICGRKSRLISEVLALCRKCILQHPQKALQRADQVHRLVRKELDLPEYPPRQGKVRCSLCFHQCAMRDGEHGYCGLYENRNNRLRYRTGNPQKGLLHWYYDSLPTNCVASWICPYGKKASFSLPDLRKYYNLAIFYGSCSLNCLFCQNWHYHHLLQKMEPLYSVNELLEKVTRQVACICFFGGDPVPQLHHAIALSRLAIQKAEAEQRLLTLRICFETCGNMNENLLFQAFKVSAHSGGCIKFDLKAFNDTLHRVLTGFSNQKTLDNFARIVNWRKTQGGEAFLLTASTPLIPGYVEEEEVYEIARYIANLDPSIPYTLLAFSPQFYFYDLPQTSRKTALRCLEEARKAGLERVTIENVFLLN